MELIHKSCSLDLPHVIFRQGYFFRRSIALQELRRLSMPIGIIGQFRHLNHFYLSVSGV